MLLADYSGPFQPQLALRDLSRQALAQLGREYMLHGHLQDRAGLPPVMLRYGEDELTRISIDEWMAASPIYSKRMQRALRFEGSDVGTIFKNLQLDIGAPHQFMDFRFRLDSPRYGEFWLACCGALMDVEPFGEKRVRAMCHDVEDPTFDATAATTHPCAKVRAIHRPPRVPADRTPHCHWKVFIDDQSVPFELHPNVALLTGSQLARLELPPAPAGAEPGGWHDYSGPFDPDFQLEDLSHSALCVALQEFALQSQLLARSFLLCISQRHGEAVAAELGADQWTGISALTAERLRRALGIAGDDLEAVARVFQLHPSFQPRAYVDLRVELEGGRLRLALGDCPALAEADACSWFAGLSDAPHPALAAIAQASNPRARVQPAAPRRGERLAWEVAIDPAAEPAAPSRPLKLAKVSTGARFAFRQRRPLRS